MPAPLLAIVEDDDDIRQLLDALLAPEHYRTLLLARGDGAHAAIRQAQPHLILLDLWLEERETGWRLLEGLATDPATSHIPIIVCSADMTTLDTQAERVHELAVAVVEKPFDVQELLAAVQQVLGQPGATPQDDGEIDRTG